MHEHWPPFLQLKRFAYNVRKLRVSYGTAAGIAFQVRAVKLRRERIVVALEHKVLVYDFKDLKLLHAIETLSNPLGLVALSPSQDQTVMACPGLRCGQVS